MSQAEPVVQFRPSEEQLRNQTWLELLDDGTLRLQPPARKATGRVGPDDVRVLLELARALEPLPSCPGKYDTYEFRVRRPDGTWFARELGFDWDMGIKLDPYSEEQAELVTRASQAFLSLGLEIGFECFGLISPPRQVWRR